MSSPIARDKEKSVEEKGDLLDITSGGGEKEGKPSEQQKEEENVEEENPGIPVYIKTLADIGNIQVQVTINDTVQDIKQFLFETADTCYFTSFDIFLDGIKLNEYAELSTIKDVKQNCTFEMREAPYDERSSRLHVRRVREILSMSFLTPSVSPSVFSYYHLPEEDEISQEKHNSGSKKNKANKQPPQIFSPKTSLLSEKSTANTRAPLSEYYPPPPPPPTSCLKDIIFSAFNPPPGHRRLQGDLFYLDITTLEGTTYNVTAWDWGFFVNSSTQEEFDPLPSSRNINSYTLVGLLGKLSNAFKRTFKSHLGTPIDRHPFELMPVAHPVHPWVRAATKHTLDKNRAEDALVYAADNPDTRGSLRDWNDEYQSCKELPKKDVAEMIQRDRAVYRVNTEFVEAATRGAMMVVNKSIPPINPLDPDRAHMYIYNNIFFSFAVDSRDLYQKIGGDKISYASVNNDLQGVHFYNLADIEGLHTILTAVIDYRGHRVVGQSIIPGILTNEKVSQVVYGSMDNGKTITTDEEFHKLLLQAAKSFSIGEHVVVKEDGTEVVLCCALDSKGIIGSDGRKYILDLVRPTPRDPNFDRPEHLMAVFRPELITGYLRYLNIQALNKILDEKAKANRKETSIAEKQETPVPVAAPSETQDKTPTSEGNEEVDKVADEHSPDGGPLIQLSLNPNVFANVKLGGNEEQRKADEGKLKEVAEFLNEWVINGLVRDFKANISVPVDGATLTTLLHTRGINVRYLGRIARLTAEAPLVQALCISEMTLRAAKHIFNAHLRSTENYFLAHSIAHFLNCLLGFAARGGTGPASSPPCLHPPRSAKKKKQKSPFNLTRVLLWKRITASVKAKYGYEIPQAFGMCIAVINSLEAETGLEKFCKMASHCICDNLVANCISSAILCDQICFLRSFALKVGIQVLAREYDFESETPFAFEDILELYPLVKHSNPRSVCACESKDQGERALTEGRIDIAHDLLLQALTVIQQVHGPLHQDAAVCESCLAMIFYTAQDLPLAIGHMARAVVINERVLGLDHHDTAHAYANLALFCHQAKRTREALAYMTRALYLGHLVSGNLHPEHGSTYTSIAMMLQDLDKTELAIEYLHEALKSNELIFKKSEATATTYQKIAFAYFKLQKYKDALLYQNKSYSMLVDILGAHHERTQESDRYRNQFVQRAVEKQKEINIAAELPKVSHKVAEPVGRSVRAGTSTTESRIGSMGSMPLADILRYINSPGRNRGRSGIFKLSGGKLNGQSSSAEQPQSEPKPDQPTANGSSEVKESKKKNKQ